MKILIIDDDILIIKALEKILTQKSGNTIVIATNGKQALNIVKHIQDFDLIILDLIMPEIDGFEVLHILQKEKNNNIPIIILSKILTQDTQKRLSEYNIHAKMSKPINVLEFKNALNSLI